MPLLSRYLLRIFRIPCRLVLIPASRAAIRLPESLVRDVWPWVDELVEWYERGLGDTTDDRCDVAGQGLQGFCVPNGRISISLDLDRSHIPPRQLQAFQPVAGAVYRPGY